MQSTFCRTLKNVVNYETGTLIKLKNIKKRWYSKRSLILGIETSCDDTGCAIVDNNGNVLGEALNSQHIIHLNNGGIIPPIAQDLHRQNIEAVVDNAVKKAQISIDDVDAIATTVKPGLPLSLEIGMKYGKYLCKVHNKPFIPIHHMEAHALTARMYDRTLQFPFLVLLISGGHCLLAIAQDVDKFILLGQSLDDAPGEAFDKIARRMKLKNIPEYSTLSGGQAVELAATRATNPTQFAFTIPLSQNKDCNFSMAGIKTQVQRYIVEEEKQHDVSADGIIPDFENLCAGFQLVITRHLCHRVQRAMLYASVKNLIPAERQTLVVSGGVACNNFIASGLKIVCDELDYKLVRPPVKLCTDNGIMIAWNGMEKWLLGRGITTDLKSVNVEKTSPLGVNAITDVTAAQLSCKWVKLNKLNSPQNLVTKENVL